MKAIYSARFDTRLSKEQKEFLEYAARISGFKSLSEFVLYAAQQKATQIIEQNQIVLKTRLDQEIFLNALSEERPPNNHLKEAYEKYLIFKAEYNAGNKTTGKTPH